MSPPLYAPANRWTILLVFLLFTAYDGYYVRKAILHISLSSTTSSSEGTDDGLSQPVLRKKSKVFHVLNIFATNKDDTNDPIHQPYNQWVALQSIERAKEQLPPDLEVTVICAMFPSDMEVLSEKMVPACDRRVQLNRSTITEYGNPHTTPSTTAAGSTIEEEVSNHFSKLEIPFVQDLLEEAVLVAREQSPGSQKSTTDNDEDFYIMLTNSDIGLTKNFYKFLLPELQQGRKAFQINRLTIPIDDAITVRNATTNQTEVKTLLAQIDASIPNGEKHPGHDCFFIHSSIIDQVFLGKMYLGFPPWSNALRITFRDILARGTYKIIESNPSGTFHLGDDRAWRKKEIQAKSEFIKTKYKEEITQCPVLLNDRNANNPHTHLNVANCGASFRDNYPYFFEQIIGARCKYCLHVGWAKRKDNIQSCKEFQRGVGPYPWNSTRRVYNITGYSWQDFEFGSKHYKSYCKIERRKKYVVA